jgi:ABC-type phosphate transport system ATPase subunit
MGGIIYFVVNLNELFNNEYGEHNKKLHNKKSIININKNFKKLGTQAANKFNKHSIKSFDGKNRKGASKSGFFTENNLLKSINENNEKEERKNMSGTHINNKKLDTIIEDKEKIGEKEILQNKKTQKKSVYDNTEYLKNIKIKKKTIFR